jgi:hypothetical protein
VDQYTVGITGVTIFTLPFNIQVIHLAYLLPHSQGRDLNRLIVAILECNGLSFCQTTGQLIGKLKVAVFDDIHWMIIIDGEPSAIILVLPLPVEQ